MADPIPVFDVDLARADGATDTQIAEFLASKAGFNLDLARKDGASDAAIVDFLAPKPAPPPKPEKPSSFGGNIADSFTRGLQGAAETVARLGVDMSAQRLSEIEAAKQKADAGEYLTPWEKKAVANYDQMAGEAREQTASRFSYAEERKKEAAALPMSPGYKAYKEAEGFGGKMAALWAAKVDVVTSVLAEGIPATLPSLGVAMVGGVGAGAVAAGGTAFMQTYASKLTELLTERGIDVTDKDAVAAALADPKIARSIRTDATLAAIPQAAAGAASMAVSPLTMAPKSLAGRAATATAPAVAARPIMQQAVNIPAQAGVQGALAAAGQVGEQAILGEEQDGGKIAEAFIGGAAQGPLDAAVFAGRRAVGLDASPKAVADKVMAAPDIDTAIAAANEEVARPVVEGKPVDIDAFSTAADMMGDPTQQKQAKLLRALVGNDEAIQAEDGTFHIRKEGGQRGTGLGGEDTTKTTPVNVWDETAPAAEGAAPTISPDLAGRQRDAFGKFGIDVVYYWDDANLPDGLVHNGVDKNTVFLSNNPQRNAQQVGLHELTHTFENTKLPNGRTLGDEIVDYVAANATPEGLRHAYETFGHEAPERGAFPEGPEGDSRHIGAVMRHLYSELGADLGGEAPKFTGFVEKVIDAVEVKHGPDAAKSVMKNLIDGLRTALTRLREMFAGSDEMGPAATVSQNLINNISGFHDLLAQGYAERFGQQIARENTALEKMRDRAARDRMARGEAETVASKAPPPTAPEGFTSADVTGQVRPDPAGDPNAPLAAEVKRLQQERAATNAKANEANDRGDTAERDRLFDEADKIRAQETEAQSRLDAADAERRTGATQPQGLPAPAPGYQEAAQKVSTYQRWLGQLDEERRQAAPESPQARLLQQTEAAILGKVNGVEDRLTKIAATRLGQVRTQLDALLNPVDDSPSMAKVREGLLVEQQRMADAAAARMPEKAEAVPVPSPEQTAKPGIVAQENAPAIPPSEPVAAAETPAPIVAAPEPATPARAAEIREVEQSIEEIRNEKNVRNRPDFAETQAQDIAELEAKLAGLKGEGGDLRLEPTGGRSDIQLGQAEGAEAKFSPKLDWVRRAFTAVLPKGDAWVEKAFNAYADVRAAKTSTTAEFARVLESALRRYDLPEADYNRFVERVGRLSLDDAGRLQQAIEQRTAQGDAYVPKEPLVGARRRGPVTDVEPVEQAQIGQGADATAKFSPKQGEVVYRGTPERETELRARDFSGAWVTPDRANASQYGEHVAAHRISPEAKFVDEASPEGWALREKWLKSEGYSDADIREIRDDGFIPDNDPIAFPDKKWAALLKEAGYDGHREGDNIFVAEHALGKVAPDTEAKLSPKVSDENDAAGLTTRAKELTGITRNPREAGYVTTDGTMLDMSGRHEAVGYERRGDRFTPQAGQPDYLANARNTDHRDVAQALTDGHTEGGFAMQEFMDRSGAVRVDFNSGNITATVRPTAEQISAIAAAAKTAGLDRLTVEFMGADGHPISHAEVENINPKNIARVFNDRLSGEALFSPKQLETPKFKRWFGDSKAVDEEGKPIVVYHATNADINVFNTNAGKGKTHGGGTIFTDRPEAANTYATGDNPNVMPAYVSLQNPVVIDAGGKNWNAIGASARINLPETEVSARSDNKLLADLGVDTSANSPTSKLAAQSTTLGRIFKGEMGLGETASTDDVIRWARSQGYESVIIKNVVDRGPSGRFMTPEASLPQTLYVAFDPTQIKSATGNNGQFDPANPDIRYSPKEGLYRDTTFPVSRKEHDLTVNDILDPYRAPAKTRTRDVAEVAKTLMDRGQTALKALSIEGGRIEESSARTDRLLARAIASEIAEVFRRGKSSAVDWYTTRVREAMTVAATIHPELASDPHARFAYTAALAITSQGEVVPSNVRLADKVFDRFNKTGRFPTNIVAKEQISMNANFKKLNGLLKTLGDEGTRKFMDAEWTVGELEKMGYEVGGENVDTRVYGSAILGPKIGQGFFQNLNGNYKPVTMDLWFMRAWGRLTGTLVGKVDLSKQRERFENALEAEEMSVPGRMKGLSDLADEIVAQHEADFRKYRDEFDSGDRVKSELTNAAQRLQHGLSGINQSPTSGGQRNWMRSVIEQARGMLEQRGMKLTNADLQAVWWYPEKELYEKLGGRDSDAINVDYADALRALAKKKGVSDEKITAAVRSLDERPGSAGEADVGSRGGAGGRGRGAGDAGARASEGDVSQDPGYIRFSPKAKSEEPFYSALTRAVEGLPLESATPGEWLSRIWTEGSTKKVGVRDANNKVVRDANGDPVTKDVAVQGASPLAGVKPEELKWVGLEDWLKTQPKSVTKAEVLDYLRANEIKVVDVKRGGAMDEIGEDHYELQKDWVEHQVPRYDIDKIGSIFTVVDGSGEDVFPGREFTSRGAAEARLRERLADMASDMPSNHMLEDMGRPLNEGVPVDAAGPTKFGSYVLPGGKNYRELLLTLPRREPQRGIPWKKTADRWTAQIDDNEVWVGKVGKEWVGGMEGMEYTSPFPTAEKAAQELDRMLKEELGFNAPGEHAGYTGEFRGSHWDEPNVLAHIRFDDRVGPSGEKVLHIAEVQSDWHQKGRKEGYQIERKPLTKDSLAKALRDDGQPVDGDLLDAIYDEATKGREVLVDSLEQNLGLSLAAANRIAGGFFDGGIPSGVPDAPFKTTWPELAMKRMLRYAAENGYDRVSWDTGETNADRYDLSQRVRELRIFKRADGDGYNVNGKTVEGDPILHHAKDGAALVNTVGKELADRAVKELDEQGSDTSQGVKYSGLDLKVGGEGMAAFYDKQLPVIANKLGKKFGAKVEQTAIADKIVAADYVVFEGRPGRWIVVNQKTDLNLGTESFKTEAAARAFLAEQSQDQIPAHSIAITDAMRGGVMQGQPLFSPKQVQTDRPMSEAQFYKRYIQHIDLRGRDAGTAEANLESIMREGWRQGGNVSGLPPSRGGEPRDVIERKFAPRPGDVVYLVPPEWQRETGNGTSIKPGWVPKPWEVIRVGEDNPPMYDEYRKAYAANQSAEASFSPKMPTANRARTYTPEQDFGNKAIGAEIDVPTATEWARGKTRGAGEKTIIATLDRYYGIKSDDPTGYVGLRNSNTSGGAIEGFNTIGTLKFVGSAYALKDRTGGVKALIDGLGDEAHDFARWVAGNRAAILKTEGRENLLDDRAIRGLKSLNQGTLAEPYALANGKTTTSREAAYLDSLRKYHELNKNVMDLAVDSGLIKRDVADKLLANPYYIPFYRVDPTDGDQFVAPNSRSAAVGQTAFQKLTGGTEKLNHDLWENVDSNFAHLIEASLRNKNAIPVLKTAVQQGAAVKLTEQQYKYLSDKEQKANTVWVMENGEKSYYRIENEGLMAAVSVLDPISRHGLVKVGQVAKTVLQTGVTMSPHFAVKNIIRDTQQVLATTPISWNVAKNLYTGFKENNAGRALMNLANAATAEVFQAVKPTQMSDAAANAMIGGGLMRFGDVSDTGIRRTSITSMLINTPEAATNFWEKLKVAGNAWRKALAQGEDVSRIALYSQLIDQGVPHDFAAFSARDIADFTLTGASQLVRTINSMSAFTNARMQGLYKVARAAGDADKSIVGAVATRLAVNTMARVGIVVLAGTLAGLALDRIYADDEDFKKRDEMDRNSNYWFKIGSTQFRIPKGFEVGAMSSLGTIFVESFYDKEMTAGRAGKNLLHILADNLNLNPTPTAIKPILDVAMNKSAANGAPIVGKGMERLDPTERYTNSNTLASRGISKATFGALSPVQIDYLTRAYTGWLGTTSMQIGDIVARSVSSEPVRPAGDMMSTLTGGIVSSEARASSRYINMLYEQGDGIEKAYNTYRDKLNSGRRAEAVEYYKAHQADIDKHGIVSSTMRTEAALNAQIRRIGNSTEMTAAEKKAQIMRINQLKSDAAQRAVGVR